MRTGREFLLLTSETLALWGRACTRLGFWFCAGYLAQSIGLWAAITIGPQRRVLSTLVFITGEIAYVAAIIMMLHSARDELWSPGRLGERRGVPATVFDGDSALRTLLLALGPFLAVYSLWGMVDERVHALFRINAQAFGMDAEAWSVSFGQWPTYAGIALVALLLRMTLGRLLDRGRAWLQGPVLFCEGVWVFSSFFVLGRLAQPAWGWLTSRRFWVATENAWYRLAGGLPDLPLVWPLQGWTMPRAVQEAWGWFFGAFLPGLSISLLLPLVWLALTAVVHGWREFRVADVLAGTPAARATARTLPRWADWATADLRGKYLPVVSSLRLVLAAGPRFLGAYLVLATAFRVAGEWLRWLLAMAAGERPLNQALAYGFLWDFLAAFVATTLLAALYLAAFDRGIAETTRIGWRRAARGRARVSAG